MMKHLGDITNIKGDQIQNVSCVCGGSPCQDLSVAGKRAGLDGERSGLFLEQIRVIKEMYDGAIRRADEPVRFAIWENVPGAFSSNNGEDFRTVLEEFIRIKEPGFNVPRCNKWKHAGLIVGDSWSIAWRLFDAQYWGVPQRRKRIALVMDFADRCAGEILFEREGLPGDSEQGIKAWKGVAKNPERSIGECSTLKIRGGGRERFLREESREGCFDTERPVSNDWSDTGSNTFLTDRNRQ